MDTWTLSDPVSRRFALNSRANVGEVFPDPISPLNATAGFLHNLEPGWRDAFVRCGVWGHDFYDEAVPHNPILCLGGYLYLNMSLMRVFGVRVPGFSPEAVDAQYFGDLPGLPSYASEARPGDVDEAASARAGAWLVNDVLGATSLADLDAERAEVMAIVGARPDLATLPTEALIARITGFDPLFRRLWCRHIEVSLKTGVGLGAVAQVAAAIGRPELALQLVGGVGDVDSAGASRDLWPLGRRVAASAHLMALFESGVDGLLDRLRHDGHADSRAFVDALDGFLRHWGFRGPNEWELRCDTWGTDPRLVLATIDRLRGAAADAAPEAGADQRVALREQATATVRAALAGNAEALGGFEAAHRAALLWSRGRERTRMSAGLLVHEQRLAALELGRRAVAQGAIADAKLVFMLLASELPAFAAQAQNFAATLAARESTYLALFDLVPPFVLVGDPPPLEQWQRRGAQTVAAWAVGARETAVAGSPGKVQGRACIVLDPAQADRLQPGDILVTEITDPSWTPLFMAAGGVVCNVGAPFSHAAIVSREIGIPCVMSVAEATRRIPDGALIEVDGDSGSVTRLA